MRPAVAALTVVVLLVAGCGGKSTDVTKQLTGLVPADTLVYVHVSLDRDRATVKRSAALAAGFPGYTRLRQRIAGQLAAPGCDRAQKAFNGADDASLALFRSGADTLSLVAIDTGSDHDDDRPTRCGAVSAAHAGRFLLLGEPRAIAIARSLRAGNGRSLAGTDPARSRFASLPSDRVIDGWVSTVGLRRLLAPQGGALALAAALLDQPGLRGLAFALAPSDAGAAVAIRSAVDPAVQRDKAGEVSQEAIAGVPDGVLAAVITGRLGASLTRLGRLTGATAGRPGLFSLSPPVRALFAGPSAVTLSREGSAAVLTITTRTADEAAARAALAAMPARDGARLPWKVAAGRIVIATRRSGLGAGAGHPPLERSAAWRRLFAGIGTVPASSLLFVDFRKLLVLAEQTGLGSDPAYRAAKADLGRIDAIGARAQSRPGESTVDLSLLIP